MSGGGNGINTKRFKETNDQQQQRWHELCAWLDDTAKLFGGSFEAARHELSTGQYTDTVRVIVRDVAVPSPVYDMMLGHIRAVGLTVTRIDSAAGSRDHRCSVIVIEATNTR